MMRPVTWKIPSENIEVVIFGNHVLESICCDNGCMLQVACHEKRRQKSDQESAGRCEYENTRCQNRRSFWRVLPLQQRQCERRRNWWSLGLCRITKQFPGNIDNALDQKDVEPAKEIFYDPLQQTLREIWNKHRNIFWLPLVSDGPEDITLKNINLEKSKKPVKVRFRLSPKRQRDIFDRYINQLVKLVQIIPDSTVSWHAAQKMVKKTTSTGRIDIDLRPVNESTKGEAWLMPNLIAEIADFAGSQHFASIDFSNSLWKIPLAPSAYHAWVTMVKQGAFVSPHVLHGVENATAQFQHHVP